MYGRASVLVLLGITLGSVLAPSATAADERSVDCGGFPLPFETTIITSGPIGKAQHASSVVSVAAVTTTDDFHALAWVVWDEYGVGWLGISAHSPAELQARWIFPKTPPDFRGPGVQVRFTTFAKPLPLKYRLLDCPRTLPYE